MAIGEVVFAGVFNLLATGVGSGFVSTAAGAEEACGGMASRTCAGRASLGFLRSLMEVTMRSNAKEEM